MDELLSEAEATKLIYSMTTIMAAIPMALYAAADDKNLDIHLDKDEIINIIKEGFKHAIQK